MSAASDPIARASLEDPRGLEEDVAAERVVFRALHPPLDELQRALPLAGFGKCLGQSLDGESARLGIVEERAKALSRRLLGRVDLERLSVRFHGAKRRVALSPVNVAHPRKVVGAWPRFVHLPGRLAQERRHVRPPIRRRRQIGERVHRVRARAEFGFDPVPGLDGDGQIADLAATYCTSAMRIEIRAARLRRTGRFVSPIERDDQRFPPSIRLENRDSGVERFLVLLVAIEPFAPQREGVIGVAERLGEPSGLAEELALLGRFWLERRSAARARRVAEPFDALELDEEHREPSGHVEQRTGSTAGSASTRV